MAAYLVNRHQQAGVALYVDRSCCTEAGETNLQAGFWMARPDHFMCLIALGCTTNTYQLCFISRLSTCVWVTCSLFSSVVWIKKTASSIPGPVLSYWFWLSCQRTCCESSWGTSLKNFLRVSLFGKERMEHIRNVKPKHVRTWERDLPRSLQDWILTSKQGSLKKRVQLLMYRHARGATSLESSYLHLKHIILGLLLLDLFFMCFIFNEYLINSYFKIHVKGQVLIQSKTDWNRDRGTALLSSGPGELLHHVNKTYKRLFGRKITQELCPSERYTGQHISNSTKSSKCCYASSTLVNNPLFMY